VSTAGESGGDASGDDGGGATGAAAAAVAGQGGWKQAKHSRPAADPNAPTRPLTAYHFFIQAVKQERARASAHATAGGGAPVADGSILDETTQRWKTMSERERRPYAVRAQKARADFAVKMYEYRLTDEYKARARALCGGAGGWVARDGR
jgi:hypothetical protein